MKRNEIDSIWLYFPEVLTFAFPSLCVPSGQRAQPSSLWDVWNQDLLIRWQKCAPKQNLMSKSDNDTISLITRLVYCKNARFPSQRSSVQIQPKTTFFFFSIPGWPTLNWKPVRRSVLELRVNLHILCPPGSTWPVTRLLIYWQERAGNIHMSPNCPQVKSRFFSLKRFHACGKWPHIIGT